jgi:hypothetical protein
MSAENMTSCGVFLKPEDMSDEEWYTIDMNDPLMMVC